MYNCRCKDHFFLTESSFCTQNVAKLTEAEDQRVYEVLGEIADKVQKRRIMMYQYFKDFDRVNIQIYCCILRRKHS